MKAEITSTFDYILESNSISDIHVPYPYLYLYISNLCLLFEK